MKLRMSALAAVALAAAPASAIVQPVQWETNGHYYEYVGTSLTWSDAKAAAEARTFNGMTGYLATLTSAEERTFLRAISSAYAWLGGHFDDGLWKWATGPEAGQAFYNPATGTSIGFTAWNPNEPNGNAGEPALAENACGACNWNDLSADAQLGYFVEYSEASPTPEPAVWAMMIGGFGAVGASLRRRRVRAATA